MDAVLDFFLIEIRPPPRGSMPLGGGLVLVACGAERLQVARCVGPFLRLGYDVVYMISCFDHPLFQVFLTQMVISFQYESPKLAPF